MLGLIGTTIAHSLAPLLHRLAGSLAGIDVRYERLVPPDLGLDFNIVFERYMTGGFRGVNITYPYKEQAACLVASDPLAKRIGVVNTVVFSDKTPAGYNTDSSGFVAAYRNALSNMHPGHAALIGAGGVGKAIAFALCELGCRTISLTDRDRSKAEQLAARLTAHDPGMDVRVHDGVDGAVSHADGIVNCTPVGMTEQPGCPVPRQAICSQRWAFDAVYTPVRTEFLTCAERAGLRIMTGFELFPYQGVQAFEIFTGRKVNPSALRGRLADACLSKMQQ